MHDDKLISRSPRAHNYVLAIHGGAGTMSRKESTPDKEARYKDALCQALRAGYAVLSEGGEALDAAVAAVSVMEGMARFLQVCSNTKPILDCPLFNSGKGAVFNVAGKVCIFVHRCRYFTIPRGIAE
jgi:beta-aspartyl-peptidase (threonine type)